MVLYDSVQKYIENHLDDVVVDGLSLRSDAARIKQRQDELFYQTLRFDLECGGALYMKVIAQKTHNDFYTL